MIKYCNWFIGFLIWGGFGCSQPWTVNLEPDNCFWNLPLGPSKAVQTDDNCVSACFLPGTDIRDPGVDGLLDNAQFFRKRRVGNKVWKLVLDLIGERESITTWNNWIPAEVYPALDAGQEWRSRGMLDFLRNRHISKKEKSVVINRLYLML